ncbi:hypothetical protein [Streptomyces sp. V3I8]|uniref:hypothetical protein n=1 Tax=Streptomyces sp. V3I8 TaxID=3042279 RepID=UPI0027D874A7|nr:hypothetical protein [Streptomyces sp. V3I8]
MKVTRLNRHIFAPVAAVAALSLSACELTTDDARPVVSSPTPVRYTGMDIARKLAQVTGVKSLGNLADKTGTCASDEGNGCERLITTDTVSVYEFAVSSMAGRWVKKMRERDNWQQADWRQVGRFALAFTERDQAQTPKERRDSLETALLNLAREEA